VAWLTHTTLLWGVGILIPTETIPTILTTPSALPYDRRIGSHFDQVLYTWPSLVDHADIPSLLHNRGVERRAHRTGIPQWGTTTVGI
jgi:hypothetical protein